jgi:hypothetical protein
VATIPYDTYDRGVLERISWRLSDMQQLHNTVTGGPVAGEALPIVPLLTQTRDLGLALGPPVARTDAQTARLDEIEAKIDQILARLP